MPALSISRELEAMAGVRFAPTNSRILLASLNDFTFHLKWRLQTDTGVDLQSLALDLSELPSGPLGYLSRARSQGNFPVGFGVARAKGAHKRQAGRGNVHAETVNPQK